MCRQLSTWVLPRPWARPRRRPLVTRTLVTKEFVTIYLAARPAWNTRADNFLAVAQAVQTTIGTCETWL